jgi:hypothetical protein
LGAAVARVGSVTNSDLVGGRGRSLRVGSSQDRENKGSELGMHLELLASEGSSRSSEW